MKIVYVLSFSLNIKCIPIFFVEIVHLIMFISNWNYLFYEPIDRLKLEDSKWQRGRERSTYRYGRYIVRVCFELISIIDLVSKSDLVIYAHTIYVHCVSTVRSVLFLRGEEEKKPIYLKTIGVQNYPHIASFT